MKGVSIESLNRGAGESSLDARPSVNNCNAVIGTDSIVLYSPWLHLDPSQKAVIARNRLIGRSMFVIHTSSEEIVSDLLA